MSSGRRSLAALAAAVFGFASCRPSEKAPARTPSRTAVESDDPAARSPSPPGPRRVIWIALDGLDPDWMDRLAREGRVPNWSRIAREGRVAKLASYVPMLSPIVWTTEATGVGPEVHRVLDFQEIDAASGRKAPVSGFSRAVPAVWNLASAAGKTVGVVGWWATHPAEVVRGFLISDRASPILFDAPPSGAAYPPSLDARVRAAAAKDGEVGVADVRPYVNLPDGDIARGLASADGMRDPVFALGRILASTRVNQRLARELYDRERPDFATVYFEGPDEIGHVFAPEAAPAPACVAAADAAKFGAAAARYYGTIDAILGQWMRRAREDGAVLLVTSDHGFKWGDDRPCARSSNEWTTAAFWHRPDGIFAAWGEGVVPGRDREHPTVFDVAPTVLALLGLPADVRMAGHPIREAFGGLPSIPAARSSETLRVERVASAPVSAAEASENAKKLVALGYLSPRDAVDLPGPSPRGRPAMTEGAWNNLGLYERDTKQDLRAAESDFRRSLAIRPEYSSPMFNLAVLDRSRGRDAEARDWLFRALAAGHADPEGTILDWAGEYRRARKFDAEASVLEKGFPLYPRDERIAVALADSRFRRRDCEGARAALAPFADGAREPATLNTLALAETCLGSPERAKDLFRRSLALKPDQPGVVDALKTLER